MAVPSSALAIRESQPAVQPSQSRQSVYDDDEAGPFPDHDHHHRPIERDAIPAVSTALYFIGTNPNILPLLEITRPIGHPLVIQIREWNNVSPVVIGTWKTPAANSVRCTERQDVLKPITSPKES